MIQKSDRILVAGHRGMVGSAIMRTLQERGFQNIITAPRSEVDFREEHAVSAFLQRKKPDVVILAAAKVGGIQANRQYPAEFLRDNLAIQTNAIHHAHLSGVRTLVFLGSSCIYPRECPQPIKEEYLLTGPLEPTNEAYALAKIAGVRTAQAYHRQYGLEVICPMPCNLYGTNDSFDLANAHVLSSLVRRFSDAVADGRSEVTLWGTGSARREFLHVDDLADAVLLLMERWTSPEIINVGSGEDVTIRQLAALIAEATGFAGEIRWDSSMPDGMPRKCLDISRIAALGFRPRISLRDGIASTVREYRERHLQRTTTT
jgi:GDP-L-fucose synthase